MVFSVYPCFTLSGVCLEEAAGKQFELAYGSGPQHEVGVDLFWVSDLRLPVGSPGAPHSLPSRTPPAGGCVLTWEAVEETRFQQKQEEKGSPKWKTGSGSRKSRARSSTVVCLLPLARGS